MHIIYCSNCFYLKTDATTVQTSITEGSAIIQSEGHVFYNPVQEFNRDLSLSVLTTFSDIFQEELKSKKVVADDTSNGVDERRPGEKCNVNNAKN